jgi:xylan 1,4-beta-xylosidase
LEKGKEIPYQHTAPKISTQTKSADVTTGNFIWHDNFSGPALLHPWVSLRTADLPFYQLQKNSIQLQALNIRLNELGQPAFLGRRQQHTRFSASTELDLPAARTSAGIVALQSETAHYYFGARLQNAKTQLFIEQANKGTPNIIHTLTPTDIDRRLTLVIEGDAGKISFYYRTKNGDKKPVLENADAKILSTEVAGGFVGTLLGIHARAEK